MSTIKAEAEARLLLVQEEWVGKILTCEDRQGEFMEDVVEIERIAGAARVEGLRVISSVSREGMYRDLSSIKSSPRPNVRQR